MFSDAIPSRSQQESLSKGRQLAKVLVEKGKPLAELAIEKSQQLANRALQEPRVAHGWSLTKQGAQRVNEWATAARAGSVE